MYEYNYPKNSLRVLEREVRDVDGWPNTVFASMLSYSLISNIISGSKRQRIFGEHPTDSQGRFKNVRNFYNWMEEAKGRRSIYPMYPGSSVVLAGAVFLSVEKLPAKLPGYYTKRPLALSDRLEIRLYNEYVVGAAANRFVQLAVDDHISRRLQKTHKSPPFTGIWFEGGATHEEEIEAVTEYRNSEDINVRFRQIAERAGGILMALEA